MTGQQRIQFIFIEGQVLKFGFPLNTQPMDFMAMIPTPFS